MDFPIASLGSGPHGTTLECFGHPDNMGLWFHHFLLGGLHLQLPPTEITLVLDFLSFSEKREEAEHIGQRTLACY